MAAEKGSDTLTLDAVRDLFGCISETSSYEAFGRDLVRRILGQAAQGKKLVTEISMTATLSPDCSAYRPQNPDAPYQYGLCHTAICDFPGLPHPFRICICVDLDTV